MDLRKKKIEINYRIHHQKNNRSLLIKDVQVKIGAEYATDHKRLIV